MDTALVILQGVVTLLSFTLPGMFILRRICHSSFPHTHPAHQLALGFVCSSLTLSVVLFLAWEFSTPRVAQSLSWLWTTATLAILFIDLNAHRLLLRRLTPGEKSGWMLTGIMMLIWISMMPLSPYTAIVSEGLGDRPSYYSVAANLIHGDGWEADYFIGDYIGGELPYLAKMPIPVLTITHLFNLFGENIHSLSIFSTVAGGLIILLAVALISTSAPNIPNTLTMLMIFAIALSIGSFQKLIGLGVATLPGGLALLVTAGLYIDKSQPRTYRISGILLCMMVMLLYRPEVALAAAILAVVHPLAERICTDNFSQTVRVRCAGIVIGSLAITMLCLPALLSHLPSSLHNLSIFYVEYSDENKAFQLTHPHWSQINKDMVALTFSDSSSNHISNLDIGKEIQSHPVAFASFLFDQFDRSIRKTAGFREYQKLFTYGILFVATACALLIFLLTEKRTRSVLIACMVYLMVFPLFNINPVERLLAPISIVLLTILGMVMITREHRLLIKATGRTWLPVAIILVCASLLVRGADELRTIRQHDMNNLHSPILADLDSVLKPDDLVAATYPQLISNQTGARTVGCTWLAEFSNHIITTYTPDVLIFEDVNRDIQNYTWMAERTKLQVPGYSLVKHNEENRYAIFRKR